VPSGSPDEQCEQIDAWVTGLMRKAGIKTINFATAAEPDGPVGLLNVPGKYVAIIDAMHQAMHALVRGEDLPKFAPPPDRSKKVRRK
jgi:hypothetical protein